MGKEYYNKLLVLLVAGIFIAPQMALAVCSPDKLYWIEGEEAFWSATCDLDEDDIDKYEELCQSYCDRAQNPYKSCDPNPNLDSFVDKFGAYIDVRGKWITDNPDELVTGQSTDRCVTEYTCACVPPGTPLSSTLSQSDES